ncbi:hypothetical protein ZIOFF_045815 [Zingiber officinale]|uniref:Uncharacterized protein n=1 Tax=Zingiber officinale TaxID=94328 RepID=A0A8J5G4G5_ZINOF|nr:hypothetical protein ZIOFF_045815 [Zingiber officinale]
MYSNVSKSLKLSTRRKALLYPIRTRHEPGPLDGNARIIHRVVGNKGSYEFNSDVYDIRKDTDPYWLTSIIGKDARGNPYHAVMHKFRMSRLKTLGGGMHHSEDHWW